MARLKNKVAIVTGGTKGIGYGIAAEFLKEGAKVVLCGRNQETGVTAAAELGNLGGQVVFVPGDVGDIESLDDSITQTIDHFGRLDIYVANAGINDPEKTHFLDITPEQYDKIMDINEANPYWVASITIEGLKLGY